jgi:hypothetical protein
LISNYWNHNIRLKINREGYSLEVFRLLPQKFFT